MPSLSAPPISRPTPSFSVPALLALYLVPGVFVTIFYALSAPRFLQANLPAIWALLIGVLVIVVPLELGTMLVIGKGLTGRYSLRGVVLCNEPLGLRSYLWLVPCAILGAFLLPGLVVLLEPWIRATFFGWLPSWFSAGLTTLTTYPPVIQWTTVGLWLVSAVLVGPIVEELYFRGFLLPRTAGGGRVAPLINALLFALYHFWQPYAVLTIFLFVLPLAYIVWWRRNVYVSIVAHCVINGIALVSLLAGIVQR